MGGLSLGGLLVLSMPLWKEVALFNKDVKI